MKSSYLVFLGAFASVLSFASASIADTHTSPTTSAQRPRVYVTPADAARAKANIAKHAWARKAADDITSEANWWMNKSDEWILAQVPGPNACYSYGFSGCPICGGSLGFWSKANATFDDPGHVRCSGGHRLPDDDHPDTGTGYLAKDGRMHYFIGSYNSWVMERLTFGALNNLAYEYFLTGDEKFARKALPLLDAIAHVYPTCTVGSWDYPSKHNSGRFHRPQYQVARVLIHYVNQFDILSNSPEMDLPSLTPGMTRRENIEKNLVSNGGQYCYDQSKSGGLHNGEADYLRGVLAVGTCLDIEEWIRWPVSGPFGIYTMLDNNLARDGSYYETASGYSDHSRNLYLTFAQPLLNYRGALYPNGLNLFTHPKFAANMRFMNLKTNMTGVPAVYGDQSPLVGKFAQTDIPFNKTDYLCLEHLYSAATSQSERDELASLMLWMTKGDIDKAREESIDPNWLLFHANEVTTPSNSSVPALTRQIIRSDFLGQKGIAFLRTGKAPDAHAAMLRYGPTLTHGHLDDLSMTYYARGYDLSYHLGYVLSTSHVYVGFAMQTVGHNGVVVNEKSQATDHTLSGTGGSLTLFADLPTIQVTQASAPVSYVGQGVDLYDRTLALISDAATTHTYMVDIFRVGGGKQHDYSFHGQGVQVEFSGLEMGAVEKGSVASPDISWGDKILVDGDIEGHTGRFSWNPPPGNGYGFMVGPQRSKPRAAWSADWTIGNDGTRLRLSMPAGGADEIVTAVAPGVTKTSPKARFLLARRHGENLRSAFVAAIEPHDGNPQVVSIERLEVNESSTTNPAVAAIVHLQDGSNDFIYSAPDGKRREVSGGITVAARFAHAKLRDGKVETLAMVGGKEFSGRGSHIRHEDVSEWKGSIRVLDAGKGAIQTAAQLPDDGSLVGKPIMFTNPAYSRNSAYRIAKVENTDDGSRITLTESTLLGKGVVSDTKGTGTIVSSLVHEYARPKWRSGDTQIFQGKKIVGANGATARIKSAQAVKELALSVDDATRFAKGEEFTYWDLQDGDMFVILNEVFVNQGRLAK